MDQYKTFSASVRMELKRKNSRFIGVGLPCDSVADFQDHHNKLSNEFTDATHIVYSYIILDNEQEPVKKYDNDGEISGTAGEPILQILSREELYNIVVFVIRYFGGVELGTGGLVRAYSDTAHGVLDRAELITRRKYRELFLTYPYPITGEVMKVVEQSAVPKIDFSYEEEITLRTLVSVNKAESFQSRLVNQTANQIEIKKGEIVFR